MHRCSYAGDVVNQQDRSAVSDKNRQRKIGRGCHEAVHRGNLSLPRPVDERNVRAVTLAHEQEVISVNVKGVGYQPAVGLDRAGIIPHVSAKVETGKVPHARSAPRGREPPVDTEASDRRALLTPMKHTRHAS